MNKPAPASPAQISDERCRHCDKPITFSPAWGYMHLEEYDHNRCPDVDTCSPSDNARSRLEPVEAVSTAPEWNTPTDDLRSNPYELEDSKQEKRFLECPHRRVTVFYADDAPVANTECRDCGALWEEDAADRKSFAYLLANRKIHIISVSTPPPQQVCDECSGSNWSVSSDGPCANIFHQAALPQQEEPATQRADTPKPLITGSDSQRGRIKHTK